jgi:hypothetical protein
MPDQQAQNKIVIFSHGMGVRKDDGGLFLDIARALEGRGVRNILFDYNRIDEEKKEIFTPPFSEQAVMLQKVIDETKQENPGAEVVVIGHSQGCVIPALCNVSGVTRVIGIAPFFHTDMAEVLKRHQSNPENVIDFTGISKRHRSDGTTTLLPPEYWSERFKTDVVALYNSLALKTGLTLIYGQTDEIMDFNNFRKLKYTRIINADGDHNFSKQYRQGLIEIILKELF